MTKEQYIQGQQIILNRMMKYYVPKIQKVLQEYFQAAAAKVKIHGIHAAQGAIHGDLINAQVGEIVRDLYKKSAELAIRKYKPTMKAGFGINQDFIDEVLAYFEKFLLEKVVLPISQTTIDQVNAVLDKAIANGWSVDETVKALENGDLTKYRARMIVRTEAVRAMNFTQTAAADEEEFEMEKQWIAIEDSRTRRAHTHAGVDGEREALDEPYTNGLMFPGDPHGSAAQTINCRCTQGFFAKRDLNGKLVRKTTQGLSFINRLSVNRGAQ
jgi:hypothetical protein